MTIERVLAYFPAELHDRVTASLHNVSGWGISNCLWELTEEQRIALWVDVWTDVKLLWESWGV